MPSSGKVSSEVAAAVELLPNLAWAPGQAGLAGATVPATPALDFCSYRSKGSKNRGVYMVQHYLRESVGRAFGPLCLSDVLRFCRGLDASLTKQAVEEQLVLTTPKGDNSYRANAAVLLGAYLLLKHEWSTGRLVSSLGKAEADSRFACSWSSPSKPEEERVMTVRDCWAGLELARDKFWVDPDDISDDDRMDDACTAYENSIKMFDLTWLFPRSIVVGADPVTVVFDPNPATCSALVPKDDGEAKQDESLESTAADTDELISTDTLCKDYGQVFMSAGSDDSAPLDYATMLKRMNVGLVMRVNYDNEQGMPRKSYANATFEAHGIEQANIRVVDTHGGLPKPKDIARAIEVVRAMRDERPGAAAFVHCKGGFGRSVVMACCVAVDLWDVPGSALMGWVRIARPGALTTQKQERFLASLRGRSDVRRAANVPVAGGKLERVQGPVSCNVCPVQ